MLRHLIRSVPLLLLLPTLGAADTVNELQSRYRQTAGEPFSAARGESLWHQSFPQSGTEAARSCTLCHGDDLRQPGKHARTGKPIEPMAPSVNPARLSDAMKVEKWLKRNCKWTLGRECTAQEKGDLLTFLQSQ